MYLFFCENFPNMIIQTQNFMSDRSWTVLTMTSLPIGANQDGSVTLATGRAKQLKNEIKLPDIITTIGKWNVRTLRRCGKIHELTNELDRYQWDIYFLL